MNPSRYMLIDERFPYPVKRRSRGLKSEKGSEPAVTLLPPDPYLIMEKPNFSRSSSPTIYRTAPPKSAKNKQASSFVILGETIRTPVQSRPGSPSGRVSPFRGHGFKSPNTTRPNSRIPSPSESPKKPPLPSKPVKMTDRPRIGRDIGLPPKSPVKSKILNSDVKPSSNPKDSEKLKSTEGKEKEGEENTSEETKETKNEVVNDGENEKIASEESAKATEENKQLQTKADDRTEESKTPSKTEETAQTEKPLPKPSQSSQMQNPLVITEKKQKLTPVTPRDKKPPTSPSVKTKTKSEGNETIGQQSVIKKTTKPPLPPKKVGMKTTLKTDDQSKKSVKEGSQGKSENNRKKEKEENKKEAVEEKNKGMTKKNIKTVKEKEKTENAEETEKSKEKETKEEEESKTEGNVVEKKMEESKKPETEDTKKGESKEKALEKVVPCFQPDKCQIAPPTMASPSPIITPTISTPSATSDLSTSPTKNSQSIAAAPTTVTPSSLSSVSSTVVLTGNLARRELENRNKTKPTEAGVVSAKEPKDSEPPEKVSAQMVKAASRDSIRWSNRDSLSGEITSTTKLIKAEPEMEVLSPNNLRDSPPRVPRIPPPNLAWDEGRLPNGDVANKAETEGKLRRFISAVWKFLCYIFFCRCCGTSKCCRKPNLEGAPKPSFLSRLNCFKGKSCRNPFACCTCCSKCKCKGKKCCRRNKKPENSKPKSRKCCAKVTCSCCDKVKSGCLNLRYKINNICRSLFCLNMMCCQNLLRKFKFCHKLKCCQKNGFCSCCNPNVKKETKKLNKKGSRASNNSRDKDNLDVVLVEHTSLMKAAIPVLPSCLAVFCLILNMFVPGFGTFISGILCLCFGKPRFSVKDTPKNRIGSFILNTIIGVAQLFTVVFCLVGWGWSVWWGVIMYKLSRRQKRLKLAEKNQKEAEGSNVNHNHVDVEQG